MRLFPLPLLLLLAACGGEAERGPLAVGVIAGSDAGGQVVERNTAEGLVALDEEGEVVPALAQRWTVLDDGSFIFRLGDHRWNDGSDLTAGQFARRLRDARRRDGAIAPMLADIDEINAITPFILELTFHRRRADLLRLLALPQFGMTRGGETLGPFAIADGYAEDDDRLMLVERRTPPDPDSEDDRSDAEDPPAPADAIELRFERAALAVARFRRGASALVLGGDWTTLPYALAIQPQGALAIDPTEGLFGLGFVEESGFLADAQNRQILSLAIDRAALAEALSRPEAEARAAILPGDVRGLAAPVSPPWLEADIAARQRFARDAIALWKERNGEIAPLRVALPEAAGSRVIFALIQAHWRRVGIESVRVGREDDADLRLIDHIAPSERAEWYLHFFRCDAPYPCSEGYAEALEALVEAETPRVRAIRTAEAARELESLAPFIPLLRPIRWALVSPNLAGFAPNRYASHPLAPILDARR